MLYRFRAPGRMNWRGIGGGGRGGEVMNKRLAKSEVSRLPKRKENGQLEQHTVGDPRTK